MAAPSSLNAYLNQPEGALPAELGAVAESDDRALEILLQALTDWQEAIRHTAFQALLVLGERRPERLYPAWSYLESLLASGNAFHRSIGVQLLARLLPADVERRFDQLYERYFELLQDSKLMVCRHVVQAADLILGARPDLKARIVATLLACGAERQGHSSRALLHGDIIECLDLWLEGPGERQAVQIFVQRGLKSSSPRTRRAAARFLGR
jgi:HEAT repeat protein